MTVVRYPTGGVGLDKRPECGWCDKQASFRIDNNMTFACSEHYDIACDEAAAAQSTRPAVLSVAFLEAW
jgi:hypothetical protein